MERATKIRELLKVCKPLHLCGEDFDKFHVETSTARGQNSAVRLFNYLDVNRDEPQKILFMGHRGSGKSTELWQLRKLLGDDFRVIAFSIRDEIDISDLKYVDLIFVILNKIMDEALKDGVMIDKSLLDNLYNYWHNEQFIEQLKMEKVNAEASAEAKIGFFNAIRASVKGVLATGKETKKVVREFIEPKLSELITGTNDLITNISQALMEKGKMPILIIEDLDKLEIPVAEELFLNHRNILTELKIHTIYTFPIFLHYSEKFNEIKDAFSHYELLSMIKVNNKDGSENKEGRKIIKEILKMRADIDLFEAEALDFIIEKSGGALRNLFEMIQRAALTIMGRSGADKIDMAAVKNAYTELKSDFERSIARRHQETLVNLYNNRDKKPLADGNLMELLYCLAVIEYNGDRWCDLHPAVIDILKDKGLILDIAKR
ncbi:MAG: ATP-binding protein [Nitrospirae bacterium]|nr:ATP-binding protein [Nitrospirota bacterium]